MNPAWLALVFTIIGWIVMILLYTFKGGLTIGKKSRDIAVLKREIEELHKAISVNKNQHEASWNEFSRDYIKFRLRVARQLGINGD